MFDNFNHKADKNTVGQESYIQQEKPSKMVLVDNIEPYNNHIIYEINQLKQTISVAQFSSNKIVHWFEIINNTYKHHELIRKPNCKYVSSMNVKNLIRKVKNKFGTNISMYEYIIDKGIVGSNLTVNIMEETKS